MASRLLARDGRAAGDVLDDEAEHERNEDADVRERPLAVASTETERAEQVARRTNARVEVVHGTSPHPIARRAIIVGDRYQLTEPYRPRASYRSASAYGWRRENRSPRKIPHHAAIGTPSVMRKPWNGPMKSSGPTPR